MNTFVLLSTLLAAACAKPHGGIVGPVGLGPVVGSPSEQYHTQDNLGHFAFGYTDVNSQRQEEGHVVGPYGGNVVQGSYSYLSPDGHIIVNNYIADEHGFRSSLAPTVAHDVAHGHGVAPVGPVVAAAAPIPAVAPFAGPVGGVVGGFGGPVVGAVGGFGAPVNGFVGGVGHGLAHGHLG